MAHHGTRQVAELARTPRNSPRRRAGAQTAAAHLGGLVRRQDGGNSERTHSFARGAALRAERDRYGAARRLLTQRPSDEYFNEGLRDILFLAQAPDDMEVDFSELPALLAHAERIARSTAAALDQPTAVSAEEEAALGEIARELHVDHGESWGALVKELRKL